MMYSVEPTSSALATTTGWASGSSVAPGTPTWSSAGSCRKCARHVAIYPCTAAMTRRVTVLLAALAVVAAVGPWIAPYDPETQHRDFLYAPPMRPRLIHAGTVRTPF